MVDVDLREEEQTKESKVVTYVEGDVLENNEPIIIHGCNCFCRMGAGIAYRIARYYRNAWLADQRTRRGDRAKLGTYTTAQEWDHFFPENMVWIVNAYTQYDTSYYTPQIDYDAFRQVMDRICVDFKFDSFAMPKIGSGLASGDWNKLESILIDVGELHGKNFKVYTGKGIRVDRKESKDLSNYYLDWSKGRLQRSGSLL